jgi:hypothetical protein
MELIAPFADMLGGNMNLVHENAKGLFLPVHELASPYVMWMRRERRMKQVGLWQIATQSAMKMNVDVFFSLPKDNNV